MRETSVWVQGTDVRVLPALGSRATRVNSDAEVGGAGGGMERERQHACEKHACSVNVSVSGKSVPASVEPHSPGLVQVHCRTSCFRESLCLPRNLIHRLCYPDTRDLRGRLVS